MAKKSKTFFNDDWGKISDTESLSRIQYLLKYYREYEVEQIGKDHIRIGNVCFCKRKEVVNGKAFYSYVINDQKVYDTSCKQFPLLENLLIFSMYEATIQEAEKRQEESNAVENFLYTCTAFVVCVGMLTILIHAKREAYNKEEKKVKEEQIIDYKVKQYEQTLPGYMEQKQAVANYRDSLRNAKTK